MKLIYITNNRLPSEKAHGIQIAKMCEAFSREGVELELIYPKRKNYVKGEFFDYYNLINKFKLKGINSWDLVGIIPRLGFRVQGLTFAFNVFVYLIKNKYKGIIYSRDPFSAILLTFNKNLKLVFELHSLPGKINFYNKFLLRKVFKIVTISKGLKSDLVNLGINEAKILVAPDGVDLGEFRGIKDDNDHLRKKLSLPLDKKIIMYTGHLYDWKGAHILAEAANKLRGDCLVVFVGGTEVDIEKFKNFINKKRFKNILLVGYKKPIEIPSYLKSADLLVLPNTAKERISSHYTSPMKLFEYMASGVPIVASNLPSIKEILNKNSAIFFEPDNGTDLANKINFALQNKDFSDKLKEQSLIDVEGYEWKKRAMNIISFINQNV